jgi:hypothetical protein
VPIGDAAREQFQLDVYDEIMDALRVPRPLWPASRR